MKRSGAAAILGALALASTARAGPDTRPTEQDYIEQVHQANRGLREHNDPDKVDLEVYVDSAYIERQGWLDKDWRETIMESVRYSNQYFTERFGIEFEIDAIRYTRFDNSPDAIYLLRQLQYSADPRLDAVMAFTGRSTPGILGITTGRNHIVISDMLDERNTVMHELSHLFRAKDYDHTHPMFTKESIMTYHPLHNRPVWDLPNAGRIEANLDRSWDYDNPYFESVRAYIEGFPEDERDTLRRAFLYSLSRFDYQGLILAEQLSERHPDDARILSWHAQLLLEESKLDGIIHQEEAQRVKDAYQDILSLDPGASILNTIAWNLITELDEPDLGVRVAREAVERSPSSAYIIDTLAWGLYHQGELQDARELLERACSLDPSDPELRAHLIDVCRSQGDLEHYISNYETLIELDPYEGYTYYGFAAGLLTQFTDSLDEQRVQYALDLAREANRLYPDWQEAQRIMQLAESILNKKEVKRDNGAQTSRTQAQA